MFKKTFLVGGAFATAFSLNQQVFGFAEIARGSLTASASLNYEQDSNIFSDNTERSDQSLVFTPGLSYVRNVGKIATSANASVKAVSFFDYDDENSIDPSINGSFKYDGAEKGNASVDLGYARTTQSNDAVNDRTESDEYRFGSQINYFYSEKTGVRANLGYRNSVYATPGYNDIDSYTVGGGLVYKYSPKLLAALTYNYSPESTSNRSTCTTGNPDSDNHRVFGSLEGEIAPKVTGNIGLGVAYRKFDTGGDDSALYASAGVGWAASEKTSVSFNLSNDFDTTAGAQSVESFRASLGVNHALTDKWNVGGSIGYEHAEYSVTAAREDDSYLAGLKLGYTINEFLSANTGLSYRDNDSTTATSTYDRLIWTVGVTAKY